MFKQFLLTLTLLIFSILQTFSATFKNDYHTIEINFKDSCVVYDGVSYQYVEHQVESKNVKYKLIKYFCISEDLRMCVLFVYRYKNRYEIKLKKYKN